MILFIKVCRGVLYTLVLRRNYMKRSAEMSTNWTKEQLQAINKKGKNILVAAAARKRKNYCACRKNYK